jgi:hypothetical protein
MAKFSATIRSMRVQKRADIFECLNRKGLRSEGSRY